MVEELIDQKIKINQERNRQPKIGETESNERNVDRVNGDGNQGFVSIVNSFGWGCPNLQILDSSVLHLLNIQQHNGSGHQRRECMESTIVCRRPPIYFSRQSSNFHSNQIPQWSQQHRQILNPFFPTYHLHSPLSFYFL